MDLPGFLLRKLYQKGSLREMAGNRFRFTLRNLLGPVTVIGPPRIVVNGISYAPSQVTAEDLNVNSISPKVPFAFPKGAAITVRLPGALLRGGNRIEVTVPTQEFGELLIEAEDKCAEFCDLPGVDRDDSTG